MSKKQIKKQKRQSMGNKYPYNILSQFLFDKNFLNSQIFQRIARNTNPTTMKCF